MSYLQEGMIIRPIKDNRGEHSHPHVLLSMPDSEKTGVFMQAMTVSSLTNKEPDWSDIPIMCNGAIGFVLTDSILNYNRNDFVNNPIMGIANPSFKCWKAFKRLLINGWLVHQGLRNRDDFLSEKKEYEAAFYKEYPSLRRNSEIKREKAENREPVFPVKLPEIVPAEQEVPQQKIKDDIKLLVNKDSIAHSQIRELNQLLTRKGISNERVTRWDNDMLYTFLYVYNKNGATAIANQTHIDRSLLYSVSDKARKEAKKRGVKIPEKR